MTLTYIANLINIIAAIIAAKRLKKGLNLANQ